MKTGMKLLTTAAILTLLLVVGNVRAEGTEVKASSLETVAETKLEIESWMTDERIWNETAYKWEQEISEEILQVENWMTDENTWNKSSATFDLTETEDKLEIETWMTSEHVWNR